MTTLAKTWMPRRVLCGRLLAAALTVFPLLAGCRSLPFGDQADDAQVRALEGGRQLDAAMREYQSGDIEQALEATRRARLADPSLAGAYELEALLQADLGNQDEYVAALRELIASHPRSAQLQSAAGRMLIAAGRRSDGLKAMQRAVQLEPAETVYARDLAGVYLDAGDLTTAAAVLAAAQVKNPNDQALAVSLARLYETAGDWQRASVSYRLATELDPGNAVWLRQNAKCLYRLQQFRRAAEEYERCLETDIAALSVRDRIEFSDACLRCDDFDRARWLLDQLVEQGADTREVAVLRGVCALRRNAPAEAERIFERAMIRWPEDPSLALLLDNSRQAQSRILPTAAAVRVPEEPPVQAEPVGEWLPPIARTQP